MKVFFITICILTFVVANTPTWFKNNENEVVQNTNIKFDNIDFSKLEINFKQVGCFNYDSYKITFTKRETRIYLNIFGSSMSDFKKSKKMTELLVNKLLQKEEINYFKEILKTDPTKYSTMFNMIDIKYNDTRYKFYDHNSNPKWKEYIYSKIKAI